MTRISLQLLRYFTLASGLSGLCACAGDPPPKKALPPVAFDVFLKHFAPAPDTAQPYEVGAKIHNMLKSVNDSLMLGYFQPLHAPAFLTGKDSVCEVPYDLRHPKPVKGADVAFLQFSSGYGFGSLIAKTANYTAAEIYWGENKKAYLVTYSPKGKIIDALLCRWEQFVNDDSSHYERKSFVTGGNRIEIRQRVESEYPGFYSYRA